MPLQKMRMWALMRSQRRQTATKNFVKTSDTGTDDELLFPFGHDCLFSSWKKPAPHAAGIKNYLEHSWIACLTAMTIANVF